jgi:transcriptional regulator GlxA family with amidase domain
MTSVALYLCPQTVASSLALANDAFQAANLHAGREVFRLLKVSVDGAAVPSALGSLSVDGDLAQAAQADILLLPAIGARVDIALAQNQALLDWLRQPAPQQQRASLCSAAFLLAGAGLLDGRRATTHWALAAHFRRLFPKVALHIEQLLTHDGNLYCSGGALAALDLCLYLIAREGGEWLARQVANTLVFEHGRGLQTQFAPRLPGTEHGDAAIAKLQRWLDGVFAQPITLELMAQQVCLSPRTLLRRFKLATGLTPNDYLQRLRICAAETRLAQSDVPVEQIALGVGYADRAAFAKLFKRITGNTPNEYRRRADRRNLVD